MHISKFIKLYTKICTFHYTYFSKKKKNNYHLFNSCYVASILHIILNLKEEPHHPSFTEMETKVLWLTYVTFGNSNPDLTDSKDPDE